MKLMKDMTKKKDCLRNLYFENFNEIKIYVRAHNRHLYQDGSSYIEIKNLEVEDDIFILSEIDLTNVNKNFSKILGPKS